MADASVVDVLLNDSYTGTAPSLWDELTVALVGIGSLQPSELLKSSGNTISAQDEEQLRKRGAVGDVCLRFFDAAGDPVESDLERRVIGISSDQLKRTPRRIGVAGGDRKHDAVVAAVRGGWVNVLITDEDTAEHLLRADEKSRR